jgi:hypothetical protein
MQVFILLMYIPESNTEQNLVRSSTQEDRGDLWGFERERAEDEFQHGIELELFPWLLQVCVQILCQ